MSCFVTRTSESVLSSVVPDYSPLCTSLDRDVGSGPREAVLIGYIVASGRSDGIGDGSGLQDLAKLRGGNRLEALPQLEDHILG